MSNKLGFVGIMREARLGGGGEGTVASGDTGCLKKVASCGIQFHRLLQLHRNTGVLSFCPRRDRLADEVDLNAGDASRPN